LLQENQCENTKDRVDSSEGVVHPTKLVIVIIYCAESELLSRPSQP